MSSIVGLKAVDATGKLLGKVEEVEIDPQSGRVNEIVVHEGGLLGLGGHAERILATSIHGLEPHVVTVDAGATATADQPNALPSTARVEGRSSRPV